MSEKPSVNVTRSILAIVAIGLLFAGSYLARVWWQDAPETPSKITSPRSYQRIIALSPSLVEVIYQLDLEHLLVGVSRFSHYPEAAKQKPVVGGYVDLDFEAVIALNPDCVVLLEEQQPIAEKLTTMGINTVIVDHASTEGVIDSVRSLGETFNREQLAGEIVSNMSKRQHALVTQTKKLGKRPSILVCIERDTTATFPDRVIVAGNKGVHQEYINLLGATNAYQGTIAYPLLSREKLLHANPDIIIELVREDVWNKQGVETLRTQWQQFDELKAVQNNRLIFLHDPKHMIPGPRYLDTLEAFAHAIRSTP